MNAQTTMTFASLAAMLEAHPQLRNLRNKSCFIRLQPNGEVLVVFETFRGKIEELPQGIDIWGLAIDESGQPLIIAPTGLSKSDAIAIIEALRGLPEGSWRFGCSARSELYVYDGVNAPELLKAEHNGQTVLLNDDYRPFMVKVAFNKQQGESLEVTGPIAKPAIEAAAATSGDTGDDATTSDNGQQGLPLEPAAGASVTA